MHVFLTGDIQVGKSTIINRLIRQKGLVAGGFRTLAGPCAGDGSSDVHIVPAAAPPVFTPENRIFSRRGFHAAGGFTVYPEVFDTVGAALLETGGDWDILLMDELGTKEIDAPGFQRAVMARLDGDLPVLGVVQNRPSAFLAEVRRHPKVRVIPVTTDNREQTLQDLVDGWPK